MKSREALREVLVAAVPPRGNGVAVDLGCGGGEVLGWLVEEGLTTFGCELDASRTAEAGVRHPSAKVFCADVREWVPPSQPSLVTCFELIEHLPRSAQLDLLRRIRQWLPNGDARLILSTPQRTSVVSVVDRIYSKWRGLPYHWWDPTHISILRRGQLGDDLADAGFRVVDRVGIALIPDVLTAHLGLLKFAVRDRPHRGLLGAIAFDLVYVCAPIPMQTSKNDRDW
jgi:SAM-dependent methyltransferase